STGGGCRDVGHGGHPIAIGGCGVKQTRQRYVEKVRIGQPSITLSECPFDRLYERVEIPGRCVAKGRNIDSSEEIQDQQSRSSLRRRRQVDGGAVALADRDRLDPA